MAASGTQNASATSALAAGCTVGATTATNGRMSPGHRRHVVQRTDYLAITCYVDARLFPRLANGSVREALIARLTPAAGTGYVAAPRIALELGAADQQELGLDCRVPRLRGFNPAARTFREHTREVRDLGRGEE